MDKSIDDFEVVPGSAPYVPALRAAARAMNGVCVWASSKRLAATNSGAAND